MIGKLLIDLRAEMEKVEKAAFDHVLEDYASYREQLGIRKGLKLALDLILDNTKEVEDVSTASRKPVVFE